MIRESLQLNEFSFLCDVYKYGEEYSIHSNYIMLRNINVDEHINIDDVYIIDTDLIDLENEDIFEKIINSKNLSVEYPISQEELRFSTDINSFTTTRLGNIKAYGFYNSEGEHKRIKSDIIRIYHPNTHINNSKIIIYVDNVINGVHYHYYCRKYEDHKSNAETEIQINHNFYSEYIEFKIPNLEDLFDDSTFYKEDLFSYECTDLEDLVIKDKELVSMYLCTLPYYTENNIRYVSTKDLMSLNNYLMFPINVTLYPFSYLTGTNYIIDDILEPNSDSFNTSPTMSFIAELTFNSIGKQVVKSKFLFTDIEDFRWSENPIQSAYEWHNNVDISDYEDIYYDEDDDDYDETSDHKQYQCLYQLEIASDVRFKDIIYRSPAVEGITLLNTINNFEFDIPIFKKWEQKPEILLMRVIFTDRYIGIQLTSNLIVLTNERYKYLVNTDNIYRLQLEDMSDIKFIDKVKCIVNVNEQSSNLLNPVNNTPKLMYKPVFYKVQELQSIQLQRGVTQNIGINLNNYMTKVNTFIMVIDGIRFIESSRNDIYVIFKIQSNLLNSNSGTYHISNQDDEYISSGNWQFIS